MIFTPVHLWEREANVQPLAELTTKFDPLVWAAIESAEIQAAATAQAANIQAEASIRAAEIAADVTWKLGYVQLSVAIMAAAAALIAGYWAYKGATKAALTQIHLDHEKHKFRIASYRVLQDIICANISLKAGSCLQNGEALLKEYNSSRRSEPMDLPLLNMPDEWLTSHWEEHALLGEQFVQLLHDARVALSRVIAFQQEVRVNRLKCDEYTNEPTMKNSRIIKVSEDGRTAFSEADDEMVVEQNITELRTLLEHSYKLWTYLNPERKLKTEIAYFD